MGVKFGVCLLYLLFFSGVICNGYSADHYFSEDPVDAIDTNDEFYQINRIPLTSAKSPEDPFKDYAELLYYVPSWKYLDPKNSEAYRIQKRSPNRKKRAISNRSADDDALKTFDGDGLPPMRDTESVKTVQFSSLSTPGFWKKRSSSEPINTYFISNGKPGDTSSRDIVRNPTTTYFNPRNWFRSGLGGSNNKKGYSKKQLNPRLGRSSDQNTVQMSVGSAFTPRLGRSSGNPTAVRLDAGNVFTPRLGRSENSREVQMAGSAFTPRLGRSGNLREVQRAGSAFTPRLGRSENSREVQLAGSAFTPRLGRSGNAKEVQLAVGSAFTPRLGRRSEYSREVQLTAGSAFTPRLGRSGNPREVQLAAGSAFTPRLGRSDNPTAVRLNAERVFTPRLGRSSEQQIQLNAGNAFTPRFGRSEDVDFGHRDSEEGLVSRTEGWNSMR